MHNNQLNSDKHYHFRLPNIVQKFGNGIHPISMIIDDSVGKKTVLVLIDDTEYIKTLSSTNPFNFYHRGLVANTKGGPVGIMLFYVCRGDSENPVYIYDLAFNPCQETNYKSWLSISEQSYLHLLLINSDSTTENVFEFANNFNFEFSVSTIKHLTKGLFTYWDIASTD